MNFSDKVTFGKSVEFQTQVPLPDNIDFFPEVALIVSNACSMKCIYCCGNDIENSWEINKTNILKITDLLYENGTKKICYTGGEPLLSPYLEEYLKKANEYGMETMLFTSDGKHLGNISIQCKYITYLMVSIRGIGKDHDEITFIPNSFVSLDDGIKKVNEKYNVMVTCVLTPNLKHKAEDIVLWCIENKIRKLCFANLFRHGLGNNYINLNGRLSYEDFTTLVNELTNKYSEKIKIKGLPFEANAQCVLVYSTGDIFIAPYFEGADFKKHIGNLLTENPKEIFQKFKKDNLLWNDYIGSLSN
jgi:MoaA/NifB/PqqE/SkfB family radical SAM enzyme